MDSGFRGAMGRYPVHEEVRGFTLAPPFFTNSPPTSAPTSYHQDSVWCRGKARAARVPSPVFTDAKSESLVMEGPGFSESVVFVCW